MTDNAKELLALRDWMREPDHAAEFRLQDLLEWIDRRPIALVDRLSARQQASVEGVARSLCRADGTAQCAAICLSHFSTSTADGKCPEAMLIWGHKCRALLAKYDIFEKVEG